MAGGGGRGRVNSAIVIHSLAKRVERTRRPLDGLEALEIVFMSILDSYTYIIGFLYVDLGM